MAFKSDQLGSRLAEVFGLDPNRVSRIAIECEAGNLTRVVVEQLTGTVDEDDVVRAVSEYRLVER